MFSSNADLGQLDLSNVLPTDDLVANVLANRQTNNSIIDNLYSTSSSYFLENSNLTLKEKIALEIYEKNGPVRDELGTALSMTIIYSLILFTGIVGNTATCIVIVKTKYLHTSVNYYLFSLACSDLLLLILGLPQEIYMLWQRYPYIFGEQFCILRAWTSETSTNASILTITAFTIERYLAICHPLKVQTMSQLSRAIKAILIIWAIAAICSIPPAMQLVQVVQTLNTTGVPELLPQTAQCVIKNPLQNSFEISAVCFFILPMAVISVLYVLIGLELRRSSSISNTNSSASHHHHHHQNSPHHLCNQANAAAAKQNAIQRNNISIVLDKNSSPTTLIYSDSKSVTFYNNNNSAVNRNRTDSLDKSDNRIDQQTKLNNYLNTKDKEISRSLHSPTSIVKTIKQQPPFNTSRPSVDEHENLIELNNNQLHNNQSTAHHQKVSTPLFLNINNGTTLAAHRPSDLVNSTNTVLNSSFNSSSLLHPNNNSNNNLNTLNSSNHNLNSALTPTTQAVTQSTGNSTHHHRHHQAATSRRSVIKMLVAVVVSFFICWSFFHAQRISASYIKRDSSEFLILIYRVLTYVSAITYYLTATINPILYQLMSLKFRLAFKETFGCWAPFLRPASACHHSSIGAPGQSTIAGETTLRHQTGLQTTAITYDQPSSNQTIYNVQSSSSALSSSQSNINSQQPPNNTVKNGVQANNNASLLSNLPLDGEIQAPSNVVPDLQASSGIDLDVNKTWPAATKTRTEDESKMFNNPADLKSGVANGLATLQDNPVNTCTNETNGQRNCINV